MNPLRSLAEYETFIYSLAQQYPDIRRSTLVVIRRGATAAVLSGEVESQPHPDDEGLASTHPHHKHVSPDIKHNRIPAPGLSFSGPNLPFLIEEIERSLRGE